MLKAIFYMPKYGYPENQYESAQLEAVKIVNMVNASSLFKLPEGYTRSFFYDIPDSIVVVPDSAQQIIDSLRQAQSAAGSSTPAAPGKKPVTEVKKGKKAMRKPADNH